MSGYRVTTAFEDIDEALNDLRREIEDLEWELEEANREADNKTVDVVLDGLRNHVGVDQTAAAYTLCHDLGLNPERRYSLVQIEELRLAVERILR